MRKLIDEILKKVLFFFFLELSPFARVGTNIVQPVNSSGKCRNMPVLQIPQKSLKWQILAFMNKIKLKTCEI